MRFTILACERTRLVLCAQRRRNALDVRRCTCTAVTNTKRITAAGIRTWADVTTQNGEWLTWAQAKARYQTLKEGDRRAYMAIINELHEERWVDVRKRWEAQTHTKEWREWAKVKEEVIHEDGSGGNIKSIVAARRTAQCFGGWELKVKWQGDWADTWVTERHMSSGGRGMSHAQRRQIEQVKAIPVPSSLRDRITEQNDEEHVSNDGRRWTTVKVNGTRMTAKEVEKAVVGNLQEDEAKIALSKLWEIFLAHANMNNGGNERTQENNMNETPHTTKREISKTTKRTLYAGSKEKVKSTSEGVEGEEMKRIASLATNEEEQNKPQQEHITTTRVERRIKAQQYLDKLGQEGRSDVLPATRIERDMNCTTQDEQNKVWKGQHTGEAGYGMGEEEYVRQDPIARLFARECEFEHGSVIHTAKGLKVQLDTEEQKVLRGTGKYAEVQMKKANAASARVSRVAVGLHMEHNFTDGWATDGSRKQGKVEGKWQTRVACGAYEGMLPVTAQFGERDDRVARRGMEMGMHGRRLPNTYEIVDAELHGVLLALQITATREDVKKRRCLIISDSLTALEMIEEAWRVGVKWQGPGTGRAPLLHAINEVRSKMELVVTMWTPAHEGVSANAYADAAAKAHLWAPETGDTTEMVTRHTPSDKWIQKVHTTEGWKLWPETRFTAVQKSIGCWIHRQEVNMPRARNTLDADRLGHGWETRIANRWDMVWEGTGVKSTPSTKQKETLDEPNKVSGPRGDMREIAIAEGEENTSYKQGKPRTKASGKEMAADRERCGVAMAAREGAIWESGTKNIRQGCPTCCSRERGYGWHAATDQGKWAWKHANGTPKEMATIMHVLCGECQGIPEEERREARDGLATSLRAARKAASGNGKRDIITKGKQAIVEIIAAAQRALAKREKRATAEEKEAMRKWLAGHMPSAEGGDTSKLEEVGKIIIREIRKAQQSAAQLRSAWKKTGKEENARRATREGGKEGTRWRGIGLDHWQQSMQRKEPVRETRGARNELYKVSVEIRSEAVKTLGLEAGKKWKVMTWEERKQHVQTYMNQHGHVRCEDSKGVDQTAGEERGVGETITDEEREIAEIMERQAEREAIEKVRKKEERKDTTGNKTEDGGEQRHGWTIATALIGYKTRINIQQAKKEKRNVINDGCNEQSGSDGNGKGIVVFDIETTELIEEDTNIEKMVMSVACAKWIAAGTRTAKEADTEADELTIWNEEVTRTPTGGMPERVARLLAWFDGARAIVGYNARRFDMRVLRQYYRGDTERWERHMQKLRDPMEAIQHMTGRRQKLSTILRINTHAPKGGTGSDAPRWWEEGRHAQLEAYCARDVAALTGIIMQPEIRLPGQQATRAISVLKILSNTELGKRNKENSDGEQHTLDECRIEGENVEVRGSAQRRRYQQHDVEIDSDKEVDDAKRTREDEVDDKREQRDDSAKTETEDNNSKIRKDTTMTTTTTGIQETGTEIGQETSQKIRESMGRKLRKRKQDSYDQMRRRTRTKTTKTAYLERKEGRGLQKRRAIIMGTATIERIVDGQYEWRDGGMRKVTGVRKRYWMVMQGADNNVDITNKRRR